VAAGRHARGEVPGPNPASCARGGVHRAEDAACDQARHREGDEHRQRAGDDQPQAQLRQCGLDVRRLEHEVESGWRGALAPADDQHWPPVHRLPGEAELAGGHGRPQGWVELFERSGQGRRLVRVAVAEVRDGWRAARQDECIGQPAGRERRPVRGARNGAREKHR
jgi:hypothetical protein